LMKAALRNRRFLVFGGAAALCLLFLLVSVLLQVRKYHAVSVEHKSAEAQLAELRVAVDGVDVEELRAEDQQLADELTRIERELPEGEYVPTLLSDVTSLAITTGNNIVESRRGLMVTGLRAGAPAPDSAEEGAEGGAEGGEAEEEPGGLTYSEQRIDFQLQGSYRSAFDFIQQVGTLGKILSVDSLEVAKQGPGAMWGGRAEGTIRLEVRALILPPRSGFPGEITVRVYS